MGTIYIECQLASWRVQEAGKQWNALNWGFLGEVVVATIDQKWAWGQGRLLGAAQAVLCRWPSCGKDPNCLGEKSKLFRMTDGRKCRIMKTCDEHPSDDFGPGVAHEGEMRRWHPRAVAVSFGKEVA